MVLGSRHNPWAKLEAFPWEKLSFFRVDVLVALLLIPLLLIVVARCLPRGLRILIISLLSVGVTVALYAQLRAFQEVGQFLPFGTFVSAISWGWHEPGAYADYLRLKPALAVVGIIAALVWLFKHKAWLRLNPGVKGETVGYIAAICLLPVLVLPWLPRVQSTPYHTSLLLEAFALIGVKVA